MKILQSCVHLLWIINLVSLLSCGTNTSNGDQAKAKQDKQAHTYTDINRDWMIVEMGGFVRDSLVEYRAKFQFPDQQGMFIQVGCNQINIPITIDYKNHKIVTQGAATTRMACDGVADSMERYILCNIPEQTLDYIIDGHHIILSRDNVQLLSAIAADWD